MDHATMAASFDDRLQDRAALASFGLTDEQTVLLADSCGTDGVLGAVVVDLNAAVFDVDLQHGPERRCVVGSSAHRAFGQVSAPSSEFEQRLMQASDNGTALRRSAGLAQSRYCLAVTQPGFDLTKVGDPQ